MGAAQSTEDAARVTVCFCGADGGTVTTGRRSSSDRFPRIASARSPLVRACRRHRTSACWRNRKRRAAGTCPTMIHRVLATALLICFAASAAIARASATLVGVVEDAQGGRLPGVSIRLRQTETGAARDVVTDGEGRFTAAALSAGEYELHASLAGFRPLVQTGLRLTVGESASVTLRLQVGTTEDVTVRGATAVNTQTGELSYLMDQRTIQDIPVNGRNYTDLMQLLPTVNAFPHRDNGSVVAHGLAMSVNGQNPRTNVYLL